MYLDRLAELPSEATRFYRTPGGCSRLCNPAASLAGGGRPRWWRGSSMVKPSLSLSHAFLATGNPCTAGGRLIQASSSARTHAQQQPLVVQQAVTAGDSAPAPAPAAAQQPPTLPYATPPTRRRHEAPARSPAGRPSASAAAPADRILGSGNDHPTTSRLSKLCPGTALSLQASHSALSSWQYLP